MSAPKRALIVVDIQQEYFDGPLQIGYPPRDDALTNILGAIDAAAAHDIPVVTVAHEMAAGAPVFVRDTPGWSLHPDVAARSEVTAKHVDKLYGSVFAGTDLAQWLRERDIDTITIVGFMTNNCDLASAVEAEGLGFTAEVLSDASGAINLANEAGHVSAEELHQTLMVLLQSNFAAVTTTGEWIAALASGAELPKSNLVVSAIEGRSVAVG